MSTCWQTDASKISRLSEFCQVGEGGVIYQGAVFEEKQAIVFFKASFWCTSSTQENLPKSWLSNFQRILLQSAVLPLLISAVFNQVCCLRKIVCSKKKPCVVCIVVLVVVGVVDGGFWRGCSDDLYGYDTFSNQRCLAVVIVGCSEGSVERLPMKVGHHFVIIIIHLSIVAEDAACNIRLGGDVMTAADYCFLCCFCLLFFARIFRSLPF